MNKIIKAILIILSITITFISINIAEYWLFIISLISTTMLFGVDEFKEVFKDDK